MKASMAEIIEDFPGYRVAVIVAEGMTIRPVRPSGLGLLIDDIEESIRKTYGGTMLSEIPALRSWRDAYREFGIKKTSYRCSVERLVKNALAGRPLPCISAFVDAYNAISLKYVMPAGADDLDHVIGDIAFRRARPGDSFIRLGDESGMEDPPKDGEVVYADDEKILCRRWNWSQDARSPVTTRSTRAVVTVQTLDSGPLESAVDELIGLLGTYCNAICRQAILDRNRTTADFG